MLAAYFKHHHNTILILTPMPRRGCTWTPAGAVMAYAGLFRSTIPLAALGQAQDPVLQVLTVEAQFVTDPPKRIAADRYSGLVEASETAI